jgi:hypothetical protein
MTPEERQAFGQKMQAIQKEFGAKYAAVLNAEQKAKWGEMTGKPFTLVPDPPRNGA